MKNPMQPMIEWAERMAKREEAYKLLLAYAECEAAMRASPFGGHILFARGWDSVEKARAFVDGLLTRALAAAKEAE